MSAVTFYLPNTLRDWPWPRRLNPHYRSVQHETTKWVESFNAFAPKMQNTFNKCDYSLLGALTYVNANPFHLRSCCDCISMGFVVDAFTDNQDAHTVRQICDAAIDAVRYPNKARPEGESIVGEMTRQFWHRASPPVAKVVQERFVREWCAFIEAIAVQAERREVAYICKIEEYMDARYDNIGAGLVIALAEAALELNIPHEIMEHPALSSLVRGAGDMITLANDMASYRKEFLEADADYNIVTVVMHDQKTDLAGALSWISDYHDELAANFLATRADVLEHKNGIPSWGDNMDAQIATFIDGLGQWVRGNDDWNFESPRYFGDKGQVVRHTRLVELF